jgi:hypothetical protein
MIQEAEDIIWYFTKIRDRGENMCVRSVKRGKPKRCNHEGMYEYAAIFKIISISEIKERSLGPSGVSRRVTWYSYLLVSKESNEFKV